MRILSDLIHPPQPSLRSARLTSPLMQVLCRAFTNIQWLSSAQTFQTNFGKFSQIPSNFGIVGHILAVNTVQKSKEHVVLITDYQRVPKRSDRDSNSGYPFGVYTLSRRASSATRAPLLCFAKVRIIF